MLSPKESSKRYISVKKGGIVDIEAAARVVIDDWNQGKMKHYATPPGFDPSFLIDYDGLKKDLHEPLDDTILNELTEDTETGMNIEK